jgi:polyisoprenoid-binding protein YceI
MDLMGKMNQLVAAALLVLGGLSSAQASTYKVDGAHSTVGFSVKHLMISTVRGNFTDFSGEFSFDPKTGDLSATKDFVVKMASVDTNNKKRDDHLRSPDFFDVAKCAEMKVSKSKITKKADKAYEWTGDLTMHCVTKPVKFDVTYIGSIKDPKMGSHASFEAKAKIKRSDWGLVYNATLEAGGVAISDEVSIELDVEASEVAAK